MAEKKTFKDTLIRAVALIGLVLVLLLGAWGIILLAFNLSSVASSIGGTVASLLDVEDTERDSLTDDEEDEEREVETPRTTTSSGAAAVATAPTYSPQASYVAAPRVAQLYGSADLAVRIVSVNSLSSAYGQSAVQFEVYNAGTNVAPAGWAFNASLPVGYSYTYASPSQQALYPGDKILYTLSFNQAQSGGHYDDCDYYNRYDCDYDDDYRDECDADDYRSWDEDEWEEWYDDDDCGDEYDCENIDYDDWKNWDDDDWQDWFEDECDEDYYDDRNDDRGYSNRSYSYSGAKGGTVTITVDPYNRVYDLNRYNNTASRALNYSTYPTYPQYPQQQYPWIY